MAQIPDRRKRSLISADTEPVQPGPRASRKPAQAARRPEPRQAPQLMSWNTRLPDDLVKRAWGACAALEEKEDIRSNVGFTVKAMEFYLEHLEQAHNDGVKFHSDTNPFKAGRKVSYRR